MPNLARNPVLPQTVTIISNDFFLNFHLQAPFFIFYIVHSTYSELHTRQEEENFTQQVCAEAANINILFVKL